MAVNNRPLNSVNDVKRFIDAKIGVQNRKTAVVFMSKSCSQVSSTAVILKIDQQLKFKWQKLILIGILHWEGR